ncbi:pleckstrin homology domain-containing family F member 1 [Danio rerio]|uniref:Pleckstrin homology domain-containing family F member 1 n=1 Tax=Danio rerio TaxID=7955 RepID=Q7T3F6_DANRE|nr:pleckstrin homology domain-containing family F member 1 [Danio rerio]AAH53138.1 Pleckstrin homology domain containing, family F (with FYVE domain) member 1 [Danio rerio]|eukprot:NP_956634.1 pleckstrin homology domain-containing family F member 1 [Danio rerio]
MAEHLAFTIQNRERIQAVESSFGRTGKMLQKPGRFLVGEGCLQKLCRRGPQPRVFYLFNDILVYGSIMLHGRWNNKQNIIPLEEVQQEDLEDGMAMANQWLIRTPRKSFYVSAESPEEKIAWMGHIEQYRTLHVKNKGLPAKKSGDDFATPWIPDVASAICMRCSKRFTVANRRHHCRRCGYIVCQACSKGRAVLPHISNRPVRVCRNCKNDMTDGMRQVQGKMRAKGNHWKKNSVEDTPTMPEFENSSDEENENADECHQVPTKWFQSQEEDSFSAYCYIKPEHRNPPVGGH